MLIFLVHARLTGRMKVLAPFMEQCAIERSETPLKRRTVIGPIKEVLDGIEHLWR